MFDQTAKGGVERDNRVAPIPPATPEVSTSGGAAPASACWLEMTPGPEMIAALADVSLQACTDNEMLDVLAGWQRAEAWLAAQQTRVLARAQARLLETAVREDREINGDTNWKAVHRQVETEISTALGWTSRFTLHRLDIADQLTERLPALLDALGAGQVTYRHAEMICEETITLTDAQARGIVHRLLPEASRRTVGGVRRRLRRACLQIDPETGNERAARAAAERSVTFRPLPDGLAQLSAIGPAPAILAAFRLLDETASRSRKDDPRTQTARRFDTLTDFVLAGCQHATSTRVTTGTTWTTDTSGTTWTSDTCAAGTTCTGGTTWTSDTCAGRTTCTGGCPPPWKVPALVQITMDLPTLLGLQNNPSELHGYGPLPAALARALAANADWQRFVQDPITGAPQDLGRTRRHPDAGLRRWIIARDRTCLFPECYRPAKDCEPDHNPDWQHDGRTDKDKLNQLCPKHHKVHHHGWHYQRHPDRITWTSPHDRTYERYFAEADLVYEPDACPHSDEDFDDHIDLPANDDQDIRALLLDYNQPARIRKDQACESLPDDPPF